MQKIIEELWCANIDPSINCRKINEENKELMEYVARHHDDLQATLSDDQKKILEKLDDCYAELTGINERKIFSYAFRLGARIAIEITASDFEV